MKPNPYLSDLVAYHRGMGRELAECIVTATAGEAIEPAALSALTEAAHTRMVSDIRDNLQRYGAAATLIDAFCAAASEAMAEHLATLASAEHSGHA